MLRSNARAIRMCSSTGDARAPAGCVRVRPSVDAQILETLQRDRVPGAAVCTFDATGPTWCTGYGWAHILEGRPARIDTPFLVASVSKTVTGVVILQGVEEGALGLDDAVNEHLTFEVTHPASATSVTLRQLMTHTSGILDDWDVLEPLSVDGDSPMALGAFLSDYLDGPLNTEWVWSDWSPDEGYAYSNVGIDCMTEMGNVDTGDTTSDCDAFSEADTASPELLAQYACLTELYTTTDCSTSDNMQAILAGLGECTGTDTGE